MPFPVNLNSDLPKWIPTVVKSLPLPSITETAAGVWRFDTKGNAGGYAWALPEPLVTPFQVQWSWRVMTHPAAASQSFFGLLNTAADDAALRLGFVFDFGEANLPLKGFARSDAGDTGSESFTISHVTFVNLLPQPKKTPHPAPRASTTKVMEPMPCSTSPHSRHITYCTLTSSAEGVWSQADVLKEELLAQIPAAQRERAALRALWLFSDSDDSESTSMAEINIRSVLFSRGRDTSSN